MNNWVIIKCDYGQLGNRLHTHVNALAWCKKNKFNLLNLSFSNYSCHFYSSYNHNAGMYYSDKDILTFVFSFPFFHSFLNKFFLSKKWINRFSFFLYDVNNTILNKSQKDVLDTLRKSGRKINIVHEWDLHCPNALTQNANWIRKIMTPSDYYVKRAENHIKSLKKNFDYIVGVHARRGDYKHYQEGRHYHSWKDYKKWIIQIISIFKCEGCSNIGFLLCSNEAPNKEIFEDLPMYFSDENSMMTDMHMLSLCDFIIGPPSSFSTWVSWHGKVKRLIISKDYVISSSDQFSIPKYC